MVTVILDYPKEEKELIPQDIPLNIVFEDDHFLIVNKDAGMVVHPGYGHSDGTLVNALAFHLNDLPNMGEIDRPGLVHRIDKILYGLLVIAKTEKAMIDLAKKFYDRDVNRRYVALVWGNVKDDKGTITGNIGRSLKNRKIMDVFPMENMESTRSLIIQFLERFGYTTLIECKLDTGRTHQIREYISNIGHPLFNDEEYGGNMILKGTVFTKYKQFVQNCFKLCDRQKLHF